MKRGIDHLVLCVHDLDAARAFYERLGFTTTPTGHHDWGTSNFLVQFDGAFLEVLTVTRPELLKPHAEGFFSFGQHNADFLAKREGLSMLVFEGFDSRADQKEFAEKGIGAYQPFDFTRQAKQPDGSSVEVSFSLAFATDLSMPELAFFTCHQGAPEYFWKPDYQQHANSALQVGDCMVTSDSPKTQRTFFEKLLGADNCKENSRGYALALTRGGMVIEQGDRLSTYSGPGFSSFSIMVSDLAETQTVLSANEIPYKMIDHALQISANDAFGVSIFFEQS
jgi:catechol 2,3-dioxygenase-like lactoylglutathione lyase family enzyme